MNVLEASFFVRIGRSLEVFADGFVNRGGEAIVSTSDRRDVVEQLSPIEQYCRGGQLTFSLKQAANIRELLQYGQPTYSAMGNKLRELSMRIEHELQERMFLEVAPSRKQYLEPEGPLFGEVVDSSFYSAQSDIANAGKCFALECWTAAVYHLMRVLEIGLSVLARKLGVVYDHRNWENIINDIQSKIKRIDKTWGADWKEQEQFYSSLAVEFRFFKNAWRNHVMHVRAKYDEGEAKNILDHTASFMRHLATQLHE